ncbi:hypothetical protein 19_00004 [Pseudomonas phage Epa19]|nr:hypothetical protein 19_00004 [Pseudomonas phage Epa19]
MNYETLQAFLAELLPAAEVKPAREIVADWFGVAVTVGDQMATIYACEDINGPGERGWLVDHFSVAENDPMAFVPDVWDFLDEARAVHHLIGWYINRV